MYVKVAWLSTQFRCHNWRQWLLKDRTRWCESIESVGSWRLFRNLDTFKLKDTVVLVTDTIGATIGNDRNIRITFVNVNVSRDRVCANSLWTGLSIENKATSKVHDCSASTTSNYTWTGISFVNVDANNVWISSNLFEISIAVARVSTIAVLTDTIMVITIFDRIPRSSISRQDMYHT